MTTTTTTTTTTTSQYGLGGVQHRSGSIMGVNAMSTSTTAQPFTTIRVLKPIINNTVRPVIVSNTVLNLMINNMEQVAIYFYLVIDLDLVIKLENMKIEMTLLLKYHQKIIIKEI